MNPWDGTLQAVSGRTKGQMLCVDPDKDDLCAAFDYKRGQVEIQVRPKDIGETNMKPYWKIKKASGWKKSWNIM